MKFTKCVVVILVVCLFLAPALWAQAPASENQSAASAAQRVSAAEVPRLIKFSGTLLDAQERPMAGPVGVTFALYSQQSGGAALWVETQNVRLDGSGAYTVLLGANSGKGVPAELFASGEARWLGIQAGQQPEHERILLVSVPYALKAGDAETLGGLPASAFVTTGGSSSTGLPKSTATTAKNAAATPQTSTTCTNVTSNGAAVNSLAVFTAACNVQSSMITQASGNVGIGTPTPAVAVDVAGNNAGMRLSGTGTHQVTMTGATSGRLGQDANGFFFASDTNGKSVRFLTNNGTLNEWMRITSAGDININGRLKGANGVSSPIAYAFINSDGSFSKGTSNVSSTFNTTTKRYEITITGVTYFFPNFVTVVTASPPTTNINTVVIPSVTSVSGKLVVQFFNTTGTPVQVGFQFVTYQP